MAKQKMIEISSGERFELRGYDANGLPRSDAGSHQWIDVVCFWVWHKQINQYVSIPV